MYITYTCIKHTCIFDTIFLLKDIFDISGNLAYEYSFTPRGNLRNKVINKL